MTTLTYKEAKSFNRKLRNAWLADIIETDEYRTKQIDIADLIRDKLETDEDLPANFRAYFHVANANGLGSLLSDDEKFGYENLNAQYHYEQLKRLMLLKRPRAWTVNFHIRELQKEIDKKQEQA